MPPMLAMMAAVRQEIMNLLREQMAVLDSPQGLTDDQLRECYLRQNRVQELRELLQSASNPGQPRADSAATFAASADNSRAEQYAS